LKGVCLTSLIASYYHLTFQKDIKAAQELQVELERERTRLKSQLEELRQETDTQLKNHEETISLLVSEKTALTSQIHKLIEVETSMDSWSKFTPSTDPYLGANNAEESLGQEKTKNTDLESQCEKLHNQINLVTSKLELLQRGEKEMNERSREQVYTMFCIYSRVFLTSLKGASAAVGDCLSRRSA